MDNPWLSLPSSSPYVLPCDREAVDRHQAWARQSDAHHRFELQTQLLPDPFTGNIDAPIVLWTANPGYTDNARAALYGLTGSDDYWHNTSEVLRECYRLNLAHARPDYPLFFLDPRLDDCPGGHYYRERQFKRLITECGREAVARNVLVIEDFPYHSRDYRPSMRVPSQEYSREILRRAVERNALVIIARAEAALRRAVPELPTNQVVRLRSRNPAISPANCDGFERVANLIGFQR